MERREECLLYGIPQMKSGRNASSTHADNNTQTNKNAKPTKETKDA